MFKMVDEKEITFPKLWQYDASKQFQKSNMWVTTTDDYGRRYFWNVDTNETKWSINKKALPDPIMHSPKRISNDIKKLEIFKRRILMQKKELVIETVSTRL